MLSKAQIKYIRSLTLQKYRKEYNEFIAEGDKICREWLGSESAVSHIIARKEWADQNRELISKHPDAQFTLVEEHQLQAISSLKTPNQALLIVSVPEPLPVFSDKGWTLVLEGIQDPGNMGTMIRIADWFGVSQLVASPDCADFYSSKVVQSAMGGHLRVSLREANLEEFLTGVNIPVYAATLQGSNVYDFERSKEGILLIGNESRGLSESIISKASHLVTIPGRGGAESLNAAISAGIICSHLIAG